jgi:hypothetical protein
MVIYDLLCKKKHQFEGWFPSLEVYEKQAARGEISCPTCGSRSVEKIPHACAVHVKRESAQEGNRGRQREKVDRDPPLSEADVKEALVRLHHYVRENFEDTGPRFAEEARRIFHGKAQNRPIHGTSTPEEKEQLDEEGVPYAILPKPPLDS